jgi:hypothetical protein
MEEVIYPEISQTSTNTLRKAPAGSYQLDKTVQCLANVGHSSLPTGCVEQKCS